MQPLRRPSCSLALVAALTACRSPGPSPRVQPEPSSPVANDPAPAAPVAPATTPEPAAPVAAPEAPVNDLRTAAQGINRLGLDLYGQLRRANGNVAIAPASIALAFGMTAAGARAETLAQMRATLHATLDPAQQSAALGALSSRWSHDLGDDITLRTANRLFGQQGFAFEAPYVELTRSAFGAPLERVEFSQPEPARQHINAWVAEQTRDKIRDLLPPRSVDTDTRLVLVNAMYMNARWQHPFMTFATRDEAFYVGGATAAQVPTMHRRGSMGFAQRPGFRVVELPYGDGDTLAMDVLLPDARDGVSALETSLTADALDGALAALSPTQVDVALPRFRVETPSIALRPALEALGMALPFTRLRADFTAIANPPRPDDRLYISAAFHKVFVEVNEAGTEAAAATAVAMGRGGGMPTPAQVTFAADHPFLFVIRDRANGAVLFMGRTVDPRAAR